MTALNRSIKQGLSGLVRSAPVKRGMYVGFVSTPEFGQFADSLLRHDPWRQLLGSFDLSLAVEDVAGHSVRDMLPPEYDGPLDKCPEIGRAHV